MSLVLKIAAGILLAVLVIAALVRVEVTAETDDAALEEILTEDAFVDEEPTVPAMLAAEAEATLQDSEWARENGVELATCYPDGEPVDGDAFDRFRCVLYNADFDKLDQRAYIEVTGPGQVQVVEVR